MPEKRKTAGRPKAEIDWKKVDTYLKAQCSAENIAELLGIERSTLYNRCKSDNNLDFSTYTQQKRILGKELLRAKLYDNAMNGNATMQIWLSKQYLEMKEPEKNIGFETKPNDIETIRQLLKAHD